VFDPAGAGAVVCSDGEHAPLDPDAVREAQRSFEPVFSDIRWSEEALRLVAFPFRDRESRALVLEIGSSYLILERSLERGVGFIAVFAAIAFPLLVATSFLLARRAFAPIHKMIDELEQIDELHLAARLEPSRHRDEVSRLVVVINRMLERLEQAFALQKRVSSDVAHEIRSPLTALRGLMEVALRKERPAEEYRATMGESLEEVLRLTRLAEDLMSLAEADAGVFEIRQEKVDLQDLLTQVLRRFGPQAEAREVRLTLYAPERLFVTGDPDWLGRVVENLVDNALIHSPPKREVVVILCKTAAGPSHTGVPRVAISVEDSGPGIAPEHLPHIFERFYRADRARSRSEGGAGLGLAIAHQIARLHGGTIRVQSTVGEGSVFTVELP
jgi:heavy metal sensor kinase